MQAVSQAGTAEAGDPRVPARQAIACLDLTTLNADDRPAEIGVLAALAARARAVSGNAPATLCVFARLLPTARWALRERGMGGLRLASVCNFPHGGVAARVTGDEVARALELGADEIDVVLPWRALLAGDEAAVRALLLAARRACDAHAWRQSARKHMRVAPPLLKVILETGELVEANAIRRASEIALDAGADFLATSTGTTAIGATPAAVELMADVVRARASAAGIKVSGGVRTLDDAARYLAIAARAFGADAPAPARLRIGASALLGPLLAPWSAVVDAGADA